MQAISAFFVQMIASVIVFAGQKSKNEVLHAIDEINISAVVTGGAADDQYGNFSELFHEGANQFNQSQPNKLFKTFTSSDEDFSKVINNPIEYIPRSYLVKSLVQNLRDGKEYYVQERYQEENKQCHLKVIDPLRNATSECSFNSNGMGLSITGVRCRVSQHLPEECFCWDGVCNHAYLPFKSILAILEVQDMLELETSGVVVWKMAEEDLDIRATFRVVDDRFLFPLEINIEGDGYRLGSSQQDVKLKYFVLQYIPKNRQEYQIKSNQPLSGANYSFPDSKSQFPPGIYCSRPSDTSTKPFPELPTRFSVVVETIQKSIRKVSYSRVFYDLSNGLSESHLYQHNSSLSSTSVKDHRLGLQINWFGSSGKCNIIKKDLDMINLSKDFLSIHSDTLVYAGQRDFRGIL